MIPRHIVEQTVRRYEGRTAERTRTAERLRSGSPITVDTPARVQNRVRRIATGATGLAGTPPAAVAEGGSAHALERILGRSDLMSVTFLELAVAAARTVVRVRIRAGGRTVGYGTGSLVGPRVLLTNNHVLATPGEAAGSLAEFNYQDGIAAPTVFELVPGELFVTDQALDFTLVALRERSGDELASSFGFNRLIPEEGKALVGESLNIIQHPNGELKQLALRENQLQDVLPQFLHYHTDTAPGSSGSPVYNDQWEVVALHHSGVPRTDAEGRYLTRDGTVWEPSMGEQAIDWIANEGVRISRIVAHVTALPLSGTARMLRDSLFAAESSPAFSAGGGRMPASTATARGSQSAAGATVDAAGFATWTVPIEIRVRVGGGPAVPPLERPLGGGAATTAGRGGSASATAGIDLQSALADAEAGQTEVYYDAAADMAARDAYYTTVDPESSPEALFQALHGLLEESHAPRPGYKPAVHVYPFVDLHPDRLLRSLYSQKTFSAEELIREDFRIEQERARRLDELVLTEGVRSPEALEKLASQLEAELPFNCEHVVPQSWFAKREPMRGDLHHLFACEPGCNSFRGNIPYFDFPDFEEAVRSECGKRDGTRFEPTTAKGIVARATLYFLLRYPGQVNAIVDAYDAARLLTLLAWHASHEVTEYERHRNMAIFAKQHNRNPLIDHPEWAPAIDFGRGL